MVLLLLNNCVHYENILSQQSIYRNHFLYNVDQQGEVLRKALKTRLILTNIHYIALFSVYAGYGNVLKFEPFKNVQVYFNSLTMCFLSISSLVHSHNVLSLPNIKSVSFNSLAHKSLSSGKKTLVLHSITPESQTKTVS